MDEKKKKHRGKLWKLWPYLAIVVFFDLVEILVYYAYARSWVEVFTSYIFWGIFFVIDAGFFAYYLAETHGMGKDVMKDSDLEDTKWLTAKKLKKMDEFSVCKFSQLPKKEDGILIGAKQKGKDVEIIRTSQLHALIVGTTGSGKTTGFVDQNIAALSNSKTKPSIIISDPKKELYQKHSKSLKKQGYTVVTLDLRSPYTSKRWNPMFVLTRRIRTIKAIETPKKKNGRYWANGESFATLQDCRTRKQELYDELYENAMDLVYTLCPIKSKDQPSWEEGARNLIFGFILALCEDCIAGTVSEKQMCLFNVYHNITKYCTDDPQILREYLLDDRDEFSKVRGLVNTVLITSDRTLTSYLSEVNGYMQQLSDDGILSLTSENEIDILNMDEKPTAMFIIVPDERVTRHRFVSLFVTQMYKELVEKANLNLRKGQTREVILKRNCYFLLDEFGNLPKFEAIEQMVTVGRSRGIRFLFVLQSFSQLAVKYGNEGADVVKSNCNVKIFIGSDDSKTRQEFSELCGQKKIKSVSVSSGGGDGKSSTSTSVQNRPLVSVGELERLNGKDKGEAIVSVRGYEPIKTTLTPSFKLRKIYMPEGDMKSSEAISNTFKKDEYLFDIGGEDNDENCERALGEIEQMENYEDEADGENLADLDAQWFANLHKLYAVLNDLAGFLDPKDAKVLLDADLNSVSHILDVLYNDYNVQNKKFEQRKIKEATDKLNAEIFPKFRELQALGRQRPLAED